MNLFGLSCLLIILTTVPLGYFVYSRDTKSASNRLWFLYALSLTMWGIFGFLISRGTNEIHALWYWRIAMGAGIIWMPVLFYHFAYAYAPFNEKKVLIAAYVITAIFSISAFTPYYIPRVEWVFDAFYYGRPGIMFYGLTIWWFAMTGYSHTKLLRDSKHMPKERQNQIKYFIAASAIGYLGGMHDFSIIYGFSIYPWSNYLVVIYPIIMAYAIVKHGLFNIFVVIKRAFITAVLIGFIAWGIIGISSLNDYLIVSRGIEPWIVPLLTGIIAVYIGYLFLRTSKAAESAKQEFVTVAAHKLRTPLTHIRYIAENLRMVKTEKEKLVLIDRLKKSNDLLIDLVNKLLAVTNLETQAEKYNFKALDLPALTNAQMALSANLAKEKNIAITLDAPANMALAEGDERSAQFIIQSLLENAIIYTPANGSVRITIAPNKKIIAWSVADSGIGITKESLGKIFEKFYRAHNALTTETEGTGLALFMSRNLAKRMGGDLSVSSEGLNKGATFSFYLPTHTA